MTSRLRPALLTWLAIMTSAWAITPLFVSRGWMVPLAILAAVGTLVGVGGRLAGLRSPLVVAAQCAGWVLTLAQLFPAVPGRASTLWLHLLPTADTMRAWSALLVDAVRVLQNSQTPVPGSAGTTFLLAFSLGLVALFADVLAVALAMPALAGVAVAVPYLAGVANSEGSLPFWYFAVPAAVWLLLIAEQDSTLLHRWHTSNHVPTPARAGSAVTFERPRWVSGAAMGGTALVLALFAATYLPTLPTRYLVDGLGQGSGVRQVGFDPAVDVIGDLRSGDDTPVLRYTSTEASPQPLRVATSTFYENGRWIPADISAVPSSTPNIDPVPGLDTRVKTTPQEISILETKLATPYLAAPYPIRGGTVTDAEWAIDPITGIAITDKTPSMYTLQYVSLGLDPDNVGAGSDTLAVVSALLYLSIEDEDAATVGHYLDRILADHPDASTYRQAVLIQDWLRSSAFTYDLTLAPPPAGMSEEQVRDTALSRFLTTKRGYCVQFATAMVLMARAQNIPARMVTGFLPGVQENGVWTVRRSDAHAWAELWFDGVGWVRFEPTPGGRAGPAPSYAQGPTATSTATATAEPTATDTGGPTSSASTRRQDEDLLDGGAIGDATESPLRPLVVPGVILLALALSALVMPLLSRARFRSRLARAPDDGTRALVVWDYLQHRCADLGIVSSPALTPRQTGALYAHAAVLDPGPRRALERIVDAVEAARYAPAPRGGDLRPDLRAVLAEIGALRSRSRRARAWLFPSYGVRSLAVPPDGSRGRGPAYGTSTRPADPPGGPARREEGDRETVGRR